MKLNIIILVLAMLAMVNADNLRSIDEERRLEKNFCSWFCDYYGAYYDNRGECQSNCRKCANDGNGNSWAVCWCKYIGAEPLGDCVSYFAQH